MSRTTNHDIIREKFANSLDELAGLLQSEELKDLEEQFEDFLRMSIERSASEDEIYNYRNKEYRGYEWRIPGFEGLKESLDNLTIRKKEDTFEETFSNCCGVPMDTDDSFCPGCHEHAVAVNEYDEEVK